MNLLTDESPQVYHPTLATWVGLNEAVFLAQLHYILTKNDKVGKFADGRKWYRDKPHDFVVKYFPFWDEGIVKRVIDNLRADALLIARSDLNQDPKDRSLWYTIHYEAIERLTGPVERIVNKSTKRKEARAARKSKEDNQSDYTKVQNVLMTEIPTNCTFDPGTKCTSEKVQNVPTPKESPPKDSFPKDKESASKTTRPPAIPVYQIFIEETGKYCLNSKQIKVIQEEVGTDPPNLERWRDSVKAWNLNGNKPTDAAGMLDWYRSGKRSNYPKNGAMSNGQYNQSNKSLQRTGESLDEQPVFNIYTGEIEYPDGRRVSGSMP